MLLLIAISVLPLLVMFVCRYPMLVLCAFPVSEMVGVLAPNYMFRAGGFDLIPMDPAFFFALAYLAVSVLRYPTKVAGVLKENIFLTVFVALAALHVVIYTPTYGQSAIGEARKIYGFFLFPLLALLVIKKPEHLRRLVQVTILATALVAIAALGVAAAAGTTFRASSAESGIMIALAAFAMIIHRFYRVVVFHPKMDRVLLFLFAALAIGLGHRSVWLAIGFGLVLVLWLYFARPVFVVKCVAVALWLLMAAGSALVYFPQVGARLGAGFAGIKDPYSDVTASWRIEGWTAQLEELQKSGSVLFGNGLGSYYRWQFGTVTVKATPHNAYVQLMLKFGLFGLIIYALLAFHFFRRLLAVRKKLAPGPMRAYIEIGILSVGAFHAYMLGYDFHLIPLIYFGVAMTAAKLLERELGQYRTSRIPSRLIGLQRILVRKVSIGWAAHSLSGDAGNHFDIPD
jgi:O-antigen ligase